MKLILSSCDFRNEQSRNTIINNLDKPIEQCRILFFPNEKATPELIHSGMYHERMQEFGFSRELIHVFDYENPDMFSHLELDVIYISGGNTFITLQRIRNLGFDKEIVRYVKSGTTYIGGCAGAHVATRDISHVKAFDSIPDGMTDFSGLGLFDGILICHFSPERRPLYEKLEENGEFNVYALTDNDSIVVDR